MVRYNSFIPCNKRFYMKFSITLRSTSARVLISVKRLQLTWEHFHHPFFKILIYGYRCWKQLFVEETIVLNCHRLRVVVRPKCNTSTKLVTIVSQILKQWGTDINLTRGNIMKCFSGGKILVLRFFLLFAGRVWCYRMWTFKEFCSFRNRRKSQWQGMSFVILSFQSFVVCEYTCLSSPGVLPEKCGREVRRSSV